MSGKRIVEVVELCDHGMEYGHFHENPSEREQPPWCIGGSRRVLTVGQYVLVEKVDGEWPEPLGNIECWVCDGMGEVVHDEPCDVCAVDLTAHVQDCPECGGSGSLLDALSDHTEGTP